MLMTGAAALLLAALLWFAARDPGGAHGVRERAPTRDPLPDSSAETA